MSNQDLARDGLVASYDASGRPREQWLVGAEFERHLLDRDGNPLPYAGAPGVRWLLDRIERNGWSPYSEGGYPIALTRGATSVTLEPGGQFELSGAPFRTVGEVHDEAAAFIREVDEALADTALTQVALGFTPYAEIAGIPWVPKGRYGVMREYLASRGPLAHHMMKGTAAVQATFDFADEADCARKVRLATLFGPLTTGLFANSPYASGRATGHMSYRGHIWTLTDPARTGFPAAAENFTFAGWVDWLLDVPMMFFKDAEGNWQAANGRTFRDWMTSPGHRPDAAAFELHLTSVFPEVRIKRTIEIRGADCVSLPLAMGFTALWKGLLYDDRALDEATELALAFTAADTKERRFEIACREGLEGTIGGRRLSDWAERLWLLADAGLSRSAPIDRPWLSPLREQIARGMSPARELLNQLGPTPRPADLVAAARFAAR